jgi:hypothetical protein
MKLKAIIAVAAISFLAACGSPYRATEATVVVAPNATQAAFNDQYAGASDVVWLRYDAATVPIDWELTGWPTLTNEDYLVRFNLNNNSYYAWYDDNGNWIGTSYGMTDYTTLPSSINTMISSRYPGYTITGVNREFQRDRTAYEIVLKNNDTKIKVLVDQDGNVIKERSHALD